MEYPHDLRGLELNTYRHVYECDFGSPIEFKWYRIHTDMQFARTTMNNGRDEGFANWKYKPWILRSENIFQIDYIIYL